MIAPFNIENGTFRRLGGGNRSRSMLINRIPMLIGSRWLVGCRRTFFFTERVTHRATRNPRILKRSVLTGYISLRINSTSAERIGVNGGNGEEEGQRNRTDSYRAYDLFRKTKLAPEQAVDRGPG